MSWETRVKNKVFARWEMPSQTEMSFTWLREWKTQLKEQQRGGFLSYWFCSAKTANAKGQHLWVGLRFWGRTVTF